MNDIDGRITDALRRVSEHHLDETPLGPRRAQGVVVERVRRRWRSFLMLNGLVAVVVVSSAVFMVPRLMSGSPEGSGGRGDAGGRPTPSVTTTPIVPKAGPRIDLQMSELLRAVRPACRNFDFQLKEKVGGRRYRPAFCSNSHSRHTVLLFSFARERDKKAWIRKGRRSQFSLPGETSIVTGDTWEIHFIDATLAQEVANELQGRIAEGDQ
jgi:hypothetical protein